MFALQSSLAQLSMRASINTFNAVSTSSSSSQSAAKTSSAFSKQSKARISRPLVLVIKAKVLEGRVVSRSCDKTAIVLIERQVPHPRYIKRINKSKRFAVHDEENQSEVGDVVEIKMCRPKSKTKKFELKQVTRKHSQV